MAAPTVSIIWAGDPYGISGQYALNLMLKRIGSRVLMQIGTRTIPYIGPDFPYLCTFKDPEIGGGIMVSIYAGNFDVWVTEASVEGPVGRQLLADIFIDPGTDYRLWYSLRTTPWPPRTSK